MFIHNHAENKSILLADANCLANKLAGAKLRYFLDIKKITGILSSIGL